MYKPTLSIVIPTYNEAENIGKLIRDIFKVLKKNRINGEVIVVDDNSPDSTGAIVKKLAKTYDVKLIERPRKLGIGSAYKTGFKAANGNFIVEMDADFSHNPIYLPKFVEQLTRYDAVVGSRYVAGGNVIGWNLYRKLVSKGANFLAHTLLRIPVKDVTTGYRGYRREILDKISLGKIKSEGYSFQLEILFEVIKRGAKVKEIPIVFVDRKAGKSKLGKIEILKFFKTLIELSIKNYHTFFLLKISRRNPCT